MTAWYNENDPKAAAWLRELIKARVIADGVVDERSIEDVRPDELAGFTQCHFFAGVGVWSHALRLAGWPDDRAVWTGSCPCQPFSAAGKGAGFADERHLWPAWFHLIGQCRPPSLFGEQVASKNADPWIDLVHDDMEALGYAFGAVPFPAAGVGAPHIRDRTYWVADADHQRSQGRSERGDSAAQRALGPSGVVGGLADADGRQQQRLAIVRGDERDGQDGGRQEAGGGAAPRSAVCDPGPLNGHWGAADWLHCRDGKWRPVEPGTFPLADGAPARVGRLRGYGNAIVAEAAAEFIRAACA